MQAPPTDMHAANLLSHVAESSRMRARDGLGFWRSVLPHRLHRFSALPLRDCIARLMVALDCDPIRSAPIVTTLDELSPLDVEPVERALRERSALVAVMAYEAMRARVDDGRASRAPRTVDPDSYDQTSLFGASE